MMKKFALAAMLSAAMTMAAFTPAFAEASTESSTESLENLVTFDDAVETALKDAGLDLDSVTFNKKMHTYEDGMPVYEIEFLVPGEKKFEYVIDYKTGEIKEKDSEAWEAEDDREYAALISETKDYFNFYAAENQIVTMPALSTLIDECAKDRETELVYYKDGMKFDDGMIVYELGAMLQKEMKFEYTFDMKTGDVVESEKEEWEAEDNAEYRDILESHGFSVK